MKQDMCRVRDHSIALRQERVRLAEHSFEALSPLWFGTNEIRDPPGTHLANEQNPVANPKPPVKPGRVGLSQVPRAQEEADRKGDALHGGNNYKTLQSILAAHCGNVIQTPEGNPVMNPEEDNLKHLEGEQQFFEGIVC